MGAREPSPSSSLVPAQPRSSSGTHHVETPPQLTRTPAQLPPQKTTQRALSCSADRSSGAGLTIQHAGALRQEVPPPF
ncbi:hypothetical protein PAL_GLEAN10020800 [Pteropus alecto]|uniref:Uncharacterized protein n=1 Tax=Pteropus alecto TaxID=9402 RepID=L5JQW6_PTEAL|nr:hypothetical protein PAL_GLEAN10020800 [Pteropus alecto]